MTMDRWGGSTHKMSAYNSRYQPSTRDQRQIDRMKRETMVLYPTLQPNPVLPIRSPGFSGGQGVFPKVTGGLRGLNWRAEGLRVQPPRNELEPEREEGPSISGFYRQQREAAPYVTRRRFHRKSPSRRPHRRTPYYPPSPQYRGDSTSEDEFLQAPATKGKYTDPTPTPIPRDEHANMDQEGSGKEKGTVLSMPLPQKQWLKPPSNCIQPCPTSWIKPYRRPWINQAPPAQGSKEEEIGNPHQAPRLSNKEN